MAHRPTARPILTHDVSQVQPWSLIEVAQKAM